MYFTQEDYKKIENWLLKNSVKDSEFQEALPLEGTETIVITQNGYNRSITVLEFINEILKLQISDFINISNTYNSFNISLEDAIHLIPANSRKRGIIITFLNTEDIWETYQFTGVLNQWNNTTLWKKFAY